MKNAQQKTAVPYVIKLPKRQRRLDIKSYIIPAKNKKKTRASEQIDAILYGGKH